MEEFHRVLEEFHGVLEDFRRNFEGFRRFQKVLEGFIGISEGSEGLGGVLYSFLGFLRVLGEFLRPLETENLKIHIFMALR